MRSVGFARRNVSRLRPRKRVGRVVYTSLARRLVSLVSVLLLDSFATLMLLNLTPGGPAYAILGSQASPAEVALINHQLGLDRPILMRYWNWLRHIVHGDFGISPVTHQSVLTAIAGRFPATVELVFLALLLALVIAIPVAVYSAYRAGGHADRLAGAGAALLISSPQFLTGIVLVFVLGVTTRLLPVTGWTRITTSVTANLRYAILPAVTLGLSQAPLFMRVLRVEMIATLRQDFVLVARARGLSTRRILLRHALRPSSLSLVTLVGLSLGQLLSADVIVEALFGVPGVGQLLYQAIGDRDIVTLQGVVMFLVVIVVVLNTVTDVGYAWIDPRSKARIPT